MSLSDEEQQQVQRIHGKLLRLPLTQEQQDMLWMINVLCRLVKAVDKLQAEFDGYRRGIEEGRWQGRAEARAWASTHRPPSSPGASPPPPPS